MTHKVVPDPDPRDVPSPVETRPALTLVGDGNDGVLVAAVRAGDEAVFDTLFRSYYPPLCDFANRYLRESDDAAEVVQDVFARIWRQRESWRVTGSLRSYLYGAVRNATFNVLRHRRVVERTVASWVDATTTDVPWDGGADESDGGAGANAIDRLMDIAARLPERCRHVFFLRWEHELTYAEIARILGISVRTVDNHLQRAYAFLRRQSKTP